MCIRDRVEYEVPPLHQVSHAVFIAHIGDVDVDLIFDPMDIEWISTVGGHERVDQCYLCSIFDEPSGHIASNEAETTRHEDLLSREGSIVTDTHKRFGSVSFVICHLSVVGGQWSVVSCQLN